MNSPEQALSVLVELDTAYKQLMELDSGETRKALTTQFDSLIAKLHKEAPGFIRDLGGVQALREVRAAAQPSDAASWWRLDEYLASQRKARVRRMAITGGIIVLALLALGALYRAFLAPDPQVSARYNHEQSAQEALIYGNLEEALQEADAGLQIAPGDPTLLIYKGVILEELGRKEEAAESFNHARRGLDEEQFYLARAQAYITANQVEKALADCQEVLKINPNSVSGYLMIGQAHELLGNYMAAQDEYNKAFELASAAHQDELAALARIRLAMLVQSMNAKLVQPEYFLTPTVEP
jgi:tetratricopeptide (TPR) repeat protein